MLSKHVYVPTHEPKRVDYYVIVINYIRPKH